MNRLNRRACLLLIATVGLAGCGQQLSAGDGRVKVAYVAASTTGSFNIPIMEGFQYGCSQVAGVESTATGPPTPDPVKQADMVREVAKSARGGIAISMSAPDQLFDTIAAVAKSGIPLIAVDTAPPPGSPIELYIGNDNYEMGVQLADLVVDRLPADATGTIVIGSNRPGLPSLDSRALGIQDELHRRLPGAQVLGPFDTGERAGSWQDIAAANVGALAVMSVGASGTELSQVRREMNAGWVAASFDLDPTSLAAVKRGELILISPEHFVKGALAGRIEAEHAKAHTALPKGWLKVDSLAVTGKNVDAVIAREESLASRKAGAKPLLDARLGAGGLKLLPLDQVR